MAGDCDCVSFYERKTIFNKKRNRQTISDHKLCHNIKLNINLNIQHNLKYYGNVFQVNKTLFPTVSPKRGTIGVEVWAQLIQVPSKQKRCMSTMHGRARLSFLKQLWCSSHMYMYTPQRCYAMMPYKTNVHASTSNYTHSIHFHIHSFEFPFNSFRCIPIRDIMEVIKSELNNMLNWLSLLLLLSFRCFVE